MKFIAVLLASIALVSLVAMPSCAGVFTKQDAAAIGAQIAQDSLTLATQELNGQPVDLKAAAAQIGIKAAAGVVAAVQSNTLGAQASPGTILSQASIMAQTQIAIATAQNPLLAASAQSHAANAVAKAEDEIAKGAIPTVVPDAPLSGK